MPCFERYIGIDYSGAQTPGEALRGLQLYVAEERALPVRVAPPAGARRHWSRQGLAEWLAAELGGPRPALVGIDHGFSFPRPYFERHRLPWDWPAFLDDFQRHWPTDEAGVSVASVRAGLAGRGSARTGDARWLRLADRWTASAKSVFQFDVQGQVANSTHAGLPWLRFLRERAGKRVHFWPFDGWEPPAGRSLVAEAYPSLWTRRFPVEGRDADEQAAYAVAAWLQRADRDGSLARYLDPPLEAEERRVARVEGWILGVA